MNTNNNNNKFMRIRRRRRRRINISRIGNRTIIEIITMIIIRRNIRRNMNSIM